MRQVIRVSFFAALLFVTASCGKSEQSAPQVDSAAGRDAAADVAGNKAKLVQTIMLADTNGTLEAALTEAAQDSSVRDKLRSALAAAGGNARTAEAASTGKSSTTKKTTTASKSQPKDAIGETEDALDKAGRTIDRTTQTVNKANEVGRKAEDLLRGTRR